MARPRRATSREGSTNTAIWGHNATPARCSCVSQLSTTVGAGAPTVWHRGMVSSRGICARKERVGKVSSVIASDPTRRIVLVKVGRRRVPLILRRPSRRSDLLFLWLRRAPAPSTFRLLWRRCGHHLHATIVIRRSEIDNIIVVNRSSSSSSSSQAPSRGPAVVARWSKDISPAAGEGR